MHVHIHALLQSLETHTFIVLSCPSLIYYSLPLFLALSLYVISRLCQLSICDLALCLLPASIILGMYCICVYVWVKCVKGVFAKFTS